MQLAFRTTSGATRRFSSRLRISSVVPPASALLRGKQPCARFSSTGFKLAAKDEVKEGTNMPPKGQFSSVLPLPAPPPPTKGTSPTISTHDIEKYVQPLYSRGWGLCPILPNGNGIAVLRKRFEFGSAEALEAFLADLSEYEKKKQVRFRFFRLHRRRTRPKNYFSTTQRRMCLRTSMPSWSVRGRTSPEEGPESLERMRMTRRRG